MMLNTADKISGSHESVQSGLLFLGASGDSGSSACDSDFDLEGFDDLSNAKILCIACFAMAKDTTGIAVYR